MKSSGPIQNNNRIAVTIDATATAAEWHGIESSPTFVLGEFCKTLEALGMAVSLDESDSKAPRLEISFPDPQEAERLRKRGGGRPKKLAWSDFAPWELPQELAWYESHDEADGMERMGGVSRRTYYRRLSDLRKQVADYRAIVPES